MKDHSVAGLEKIYFTFAPAAAATRRVNFCFAHENTG